MTKAVITGACARLLHLSGSGGAIFSMLPAGTSKTVRVVAPSKSMPFAPSVGENLSVWGKFVSDRKYGLQLHAESVTRSVPTGKGIVGLLSKHPDFAWLSALSAKRLWKRLGDRLYEALAEPNVQVLADGANISTMNALALVRCWRQYTLELDLYSFLGMHDFPRELAGPVAKYWGKNFRDVLTTNPYILVSLASWSIVESSCTGEHGIPYSQADRLIAACTSSADDFVEHRNEIGIPVAELIKRLTLKLGNKELANRALKLSQDSGHLQIIREHGSTVFQTKGLHHLQLALRRRISAFADAASSSTNHIGTNSESRNFHGGVVFWDDLDRAKCALFLRELRDAQHIFPSISMGHQFFIQRSEFRIFSEIDNSDDASELWASRYYIVYCVDSVGLTTMNRVLHRIPENSTAILIPSFTSPTDSPNKFWSWLLTLPDVRRASAMHWTTSEQNKTCGPARTNMNLTAASSVNLREAVSFRLIAADGPEGAAKAILKAYRQAAHLHSALIVTGTKTACKLLNQTLHIEAVELREFEGLPAISLRLRNGVSATVGDRIVAKYANYENKIVVGTLGVITEISHPMNDGLHGKFSSNLIAATVFLDTVGLVRLTFADCALFDLGYAVPVELDRWSAFDHRIVYLDSPELLRVNHFYQLITMTRDSVSFLGEQEQLGALRASNLITLEP